MERNELNAAVKKDLKGYMLYNQSTGRLSKKAITAYIDIPNYLPMIRNGSFKLYNTPNKPNMQVILYNNTNEKNRYGVIVDDANKIIYSSFSSKDPIMDDFRALKSILKAFA